MALSETEIQSAPVGLTDTDKDDEKRIRRFICWAVEHDYLESPAAGKLLTGLTVHIQNEPREREKRWSGQ